MKLYFAGGSKSGYLPALITTGAKHWLSSFHGIDKSVLEGSEEYRLKNSNDGPKEKQNASTTQSSGLNRRRQRR